MGECVCVRFISCEYRNSSNKTQHQKKKTPTKQEPVNVQLFHHNSISYISNVLATHTRRHTHTHRQMKRIFVFVTLQLYKTWKKWPIPQGCGVVSKILMYTNNNKNGKPEVITFQAYHLLSSSNSNNNNKSQLFHHQLKIW